MDIKAIMGKDPSLIAKMLFSVDTRIQLWLSDGRTATDREEMDDSVINLTSIVTSVLTDQLVVSLPPCLTTTAKKTEDDGVLKSPLKKKKKIKEDEEKNSKNRKIVNQSALAAFRLLENENYKEVFANRHVEARPMWDDKCRMCPRWHTLGYCFADCKHKASHVPEDEIPADHRTAYSEYLVICRRN
jgi:hypothetical protein